MSNQRCPYCFLVDGVHLVGCPNYLPPDKRKDKVSFEDMFSNIFSTTTVKQGEKK